jgi:hypothetical protein
LKARKVKGIDPDAPLAQNALRIIAVRLDELRSFSAAVHDPSAVTELHDMRIAAKRLRYVLEMTAPALGPAAEEGAKDAKKLQDVLGEIHDCDEFEPRVEAHIARLRAEDTAAVRAAATPQSKDLEPGAARDAPNRLHYRGLETLGTYIRARREVLYSQFLREWERVERDRLSPALLDRLQGSTVERRDGHE